VAEVSRKVLGMRYRAMPYLYTQHFFAHTAGCPIARPLFFTFPADNATRNVSDQWMIGDALMVSPVIQQVRHKQGFVGSLPNISLTLKPSRCVVIMRACASGGCVVAWGRCEASRSVVKGNR